MIGKTISHYRIIEKLGEGGMGVVYKAEDLTLTRAVALKFLPHGLEAHEPERARFLQEARAAAILNHPNICTIHEIAEAEGQQFIVMEYVEGKTLREIVPVKKTQDAITYAIQIAEALHEAHTHGIVHRDIKAENIMVNTKNQVKVMDFGLAKLKGSLKLTKATSTVGTLAYMSPEHIQGGNVDTRSDIFSFGVVLYEILTGHLPFRGEHQAAMVYSIVNEALIPPQKYVPGISSELIHVLDRSLEKDPEERYQSARDMAIDLRRLKRETPRVITVGSATITGTPETAEHGKLLHTRTRRFSKGRTILATAVIALAGIGIVLLLQPRRPTFNPDFTTRTLDIPVTNIGNVSLSRDGNWAAFPAVDPSEKRWLYFMNLSKRDPRPLVSETSLQISDADISPDAAEVLFSGIFPGRTLHSIYVVSSQGGSPRQVTEPGWLCRYRPDGKRFGYIRGTVSYASASGHVEFWTASPVGGDVRREFIDSVSTGDITASFDWSSHAASVAWIRSYPDGTNEITVRDLGTGNERQLTSQHAKINSVAWCTNGQIFFSSSKSGNTNIWMISSEGGEPVQVTRGGGPDVGMRLSADGKRMLYVIRQRIDNIWTADIDGRNARQLTYDNCSLGCPAFSPDGSCIAFTLAPADPGKSGNQVFMMKTDGTNRRQVSFDDANHRVPLVSPDGKWLTYSSYGIAESSDSMKVYLADLANPGSPKCLGNGNFGYWLNADTLVIPFGRNCSLYSLRNMRTISVRSDSTWEFPIDKGKSVLVLDQKKGSEGWWVSTHGSGSAPRPVLGAGSLRYSWLTPSMRSVCELTQSGQVVRMPISGGKPQTLPAIFGNLNPWTSQIFMSYDDRKVGFVRSRSEGKIVLVEQLFR
jgi:serine/threonine protein kinase